MLLLAWLAYRPGLSGGFLFDDFVNLDALGSTGPVDNWPTFWRYLTSGSADPTGRPLAMLSFLIDARDWPASPAPFLRTNLLLHLLNGVLLWALLRKLSAAVGTAGPTQEAAALVGAAIWLLHPLLVSTILYVVQREAMLPATFVLLGLLSYAGGRLAFAASAGTAGTRRMVSGVLIGTGLAVLSKGNGVLLPLFAWILEATVFRCLPIAGLAANARLRLLRRCLLVLPSLLLFAYLATFLPSLSQPPGVRSFSTAQRLLTEPRILLDYLQLLLVPRSVSTGLYNDAYPLSTDLLHPWTTLPALLTIAALFWGGLRLRERAPAISAALLFFLAGHLLESTLIPLELYFEHRNYLPSMLLPWPLALAIAGSSRPLRLRILASALLLAMLATITFQRASLWGQPDKMAQLWAIQQRSSSRAQAAAAIAELKAGRVEPALLRLGPLWREHPFDLQIAFNFISARCARTGPTADEKSDLAQALLRTPQSALLTHEWLASAIDLAHSGGCPGLTPDDVAAWVDAASRNPRMSGRLRDEDIEPLFGKLAIAMGKPDMALLHFDRALQARPTPDTAARQAVMLASNEYFAQALAHLDTYERLKSRLPEPGLGMALLHAKVLEWQGYWPQEMAFLRARLRTEIQRGRSGDGQ